MSERLCKCGAYDLGIAAPHSVHGEPAQVCYQVEGAPQFGREAHTERECYREVPVTEAWTLALREWKESLRDGNGRPLPAPMPVGHLMFSAIPGSAALSRRDNAAREQVQP